ncbi:MAG: UvrB/UvrC motif-containing protein [bacterium]|nr:UvrB/UvrC motif-containing protein [bacterium]MDZ4284819.1 UvrB/UvrC motif-containing protein [Patescibacteria group bacterium]
MKSQEVTQLKLPDTPGVYFFVKGIGTGREVLYIGKATSLADRVKSYFSADVLAARGEHIARMVAEADTIEWEQTDSVLEALLREAALIKKYQPHGNVIGKDDKSFNHVVITDEPFPRILTLRGKDLAEVLAGRMAHKLTRRDIKWTFGPFTSGSSLKEALKLVRKIFPFRDQCVPCEEHTDRRSQKGKLLSRAPRQPTVPSYPLPVTDPSCTPCFNVQIGLCPGVCSGVINRKDYNRIVQHIKLFFDGKKKTLLGELERDMKVFARQQEFEKAAEVRRELHALRHIQDIALLKRTTEADTVRTEHGQGAEPAVRRAYRIEAYDVAHLGGEETVGVMVAIVNGERETTEYRQFRVRGNTRGSDIDALREVLERRFAHDEWPLPQLIVVDGGEAQIGTAERALRAHFGPDVPPIPLIGVVKDARHRPREIRGLKNTPAQTTRALIAKHERAILLANSEAHRFAINFHRKRRRKNIV